MRQRIATRVGRSLVVIETKDITHFSAEEKYVTAFTAKGRIHFDATLKALEIEFAEEFIRIHRSHLVRRSLVSNLRWDAYSASIGIDGRKQVSPDKWRLAFPTLAAYRDEWLRQARDFATQSFAEDTRTAIFTTTTLEDIEIEGDMALVRKKFDGGLTKSDGSRDIMQWQTLYYCRLHEGRWKICGFTGYLPNPMG